MNTISIVKTEYKTSPPKVVADVNYDVGVFFNSTESRAQAFSKLLKQVGTCILVDFDGEGDPRKVENKTKNKGYLKDISKDIHYLPFKDIFEYKDNLDSIAYQILEVCNRIKDPKVFIDITGAPLIYSVALTKFILRLYPSPKVYLLNVSGIYKDRDKQQFSIGEQYDMYVPGYYGRPDHSKRMHYIFLLGYDGERSLKIYRDNLPGKVSVIVPSPGYEEGNDRNTINNNRRFLLETGFSDEVELCDDQSFKWESYNRPRFYCIDISDIEGVKKKIEEIFEADKENYEIRLVPLGPKPHAIGAGLSAVFNDKISIVYQVPKKYYLSEVPCGEKMWLYEINVD